MTDVVLLNSGGQDSAMLACKLQRDGFVIHSLYVDTRQLNTVAAQVAAAETARRYCADHKVLLIDFGQTSAELVFSDRSVMWDEATEEERTTADFIGVCPNHSLVNMSMGVMYARFVYALEVYGAWMKVIDGEFVDTYNNLRDHQLINGIIRPQVILPFSEMTTKSEVASYCECDPADFSYAYSCKMSNTPCGNCLKCRTRI